MTQVDYDSWRPTHNCIDRIRKTIKFDPLFAVEVVLSGPSGPNDTMELGILSRDDSEFFSHLRSVARMMEERTGLSVNAKRVTGGLWQYLDKDTYKPRVFSASDYDKQPAKDLFVSQKFLGRQVIVQFLLTEEGISANTLRVSMDQTLKELKCSTKELQSFNIGDGTVIAAVFNQGSVTLVWDGATHIDVNIYLHRQYEREMHK